jgi:hypothetical protein
VKRCPAASMKSSAATAAVESSSPATMASTLGKRRLRQPTKRNHRDEDKNDSK